MPSAVAAFRLLLPTGCRLSQIQFLRWAYVKDVKDDCIELPNAKTEGWVVPLGPEARAVLAALPRGEENAKTIAGRLPDSHIADLQKPWRRIRARRPRGHASPRPEAHVCVQNAQRREFCTTLVVPLYLTSTPSQGS